MVGGIDVPLGFYRPEELIHPLVYANCSRSFSALTKVISVDRDVSLAGLQGMGGNGFPCVRRNHHVYPFCNPHPYILTSIEARNGIAVAPEGDETVPAYLVRSPPPDAP